MVGGFCNSQNENVGCVLVVRRRIFWRRTFSVIRFILTYPADKVNRMNARGGRLSFCGVKRKIEMLLEKNVFFLENVLTNREYGCKIII